MSLQHGSLSRIIAGCHAVGAWAKRRLRDSHRLDPDALARSFGLTEREARAVALADPDYREGLARAFQAEGGLHVAARLQSAESARRFHNNRNEAARIGRAFWFEWAPDTEFEDVRTQDLILDDADSEGPPPALRGRELDDTTPLPVSHDRWVTPLFDSREVKI